MGGWHVQEFETIPASKFGKQRQAWLGCGGSKSSGMGRIEGVCQHDRRREANSAEECISGEVRWLEGAFGHAFLQGPVSCLGWTFSDRHCVPHRHHWWRLEEIASSIRLR